MRLASRFLPLAALLLFGACVEELPLPGGRAEILGRTELLEEGGPGCLVVGYSIENLGKLPIERSVLSFRFETERRAYHFTAVEELRIPSGGLIFGTTLLEYLEEGEVGDLDSLELAAAFYE